MKTLTLTLAAMLTLGAATLNAADNTIKVPEAKLTSMDYNKSGARDVSTTVTFPLLEKKEGKIPVLKAKIYYEAPKVTYGNYGGKLILNNKKIDDKTKDGKNRLLRLAPETDKKGSKDGMRAQWYQKSNSGWYILCGPGTGKPGRIIYPVDGDGWIFHFDISDLAEYTGSTAKENVLKFVCGPQGGIRTVKYTDMEIVYMTEAEMDALRQK